MKKLTVDQIALFLNSLKSEYVLRVPIRLLDGTRSLGDLEEGALALFGGKIPRKTTSVFFSQMEEVFIWFKERDMQTESTISRPFFVLGLTAEDAECLSFIDKFFSENFRDDVYFKKRDRSVVAVLSGKCGQGGEFLKISAGNCDLEFVCDGEAFIVAAYSEKGRELERHLAAAREDASLDELKKMSDSLPRDDLQAIQKASELILQEKVPDSFWNEIGDQCIVCTACNLACPTCTCFDVYDRRDGDRVMRQRIWDSCQLDGFMREASGHNPMGTEGLRTRRRIHHKLAADVTRWGHITCFLCGRCDEVCPTNIGIKSVCREIVRRYS